MMSLKPNRINAMDDTQAVLRVLAYADKEIDAGETVPIEEVMKEFSVEAHKSLKATLD